VAEYHATAIILYCVLPSFGLEGGVVFVPFDQDIFFGTTLHQKGVTLLMPHR